MNFLTKSPCLRILCLEIFLSLNSFSSLAMQPMLLVNSRVLVMLQAYNLQYYFFLLLPFFSVQLLLLLEYTFSSLLLLITTLIVLRCNHGQMPPNCSQCDQQSNLDAAIDHNQEAIALNDVSAKLKSWKHVSVAAVCVGTKLFFERELIIYQFIEHAEIVGKAKRFADVNQRTTKTERRMTKNN